MEKLHELDAYVSIFNGVKAKNPLGTQSVFSIIDDIRTGGQWLEQILTLREEYQRLSLIEDEDEAKEQKAIIDNTYKKTLKGITFNGTFSQRNGESFLEPSGFAVIDFDSAENPEEMKQIITDDDFCFSAFISPTGRGVKAIYRIPKETDTDKLKGRLIALLAFIKYKFKNEIQSDKVLVDESCVDIPRLCLTSYDSSIYVNEGAFVFDGIEEIKKAERIDYSHIPKPENINEDEVKEFIRNFINEKFPDKMKEGTRYDTLKKMSPKLIAWSIYYGLDINEVMSWVAERYTGQFKGFEKEERLRGVTTMWRQYVSDGRIVPNPIQEFNTLNGFLEQRKKSNEVKIEADIKIPLNIDSGVFTWDKMLKIRPIQERLLLTLPVLDKTNNEEIQGRYLERGSIASIVAAPSSGKTSLTNAIASQCLVNSNQRQSVKKIHFQVEPIVKRALVFDSELGFNDYFDLYKQMSNRIYGKDNTSETTIRNLIQNDNLIYFSWLDYSVETQENDPKIIFEHIVRKAHEEGNPFDLVILDDITVFTPDVNNSEATTKVVFWILRLARELDFGVFATIHSNSGSDSGKARGHVGSEVERKSQTNLHLIRDNETRLFKIALGQGNKNRHGALTFAMYDNPLYSEWSKEWDCIVEIPQIDSVDIVNQRRALNKTPDDLLFDYVCERIDNYLKKEKPVKSKEVKDFIQDYYRKDSKSPLSADGLKRKFTMVKDKIVEKNVFKATEQRGIGFTFEGLPMENETEITHKVISPSLDDDDLSFLDEILREDME